MSALEDTLVFQLHVMGVPAPVREFRFDPTRRWRADLAWPDLRLLVEVEGGTFVRGRHSRPVGMRTDAMKYNAALLLGFRVLRVTSDMVKDGSALDVIQEAVDLFGPHQPHLETHE